MINNVIIPDVGASSDCVEIIRVQKARRVVIVEEDNLTGGWGAEVAARVGEAAFGLLERPVMRLAAPDTPAPCCLTLEREYVPTIEKITGIVRRIATEPPNSHQ